MNAEALAPADTNPNQYTKVSNPTDSILPPDSGSPAASGSASSDTPETDKAAIALHGTRLAPGCLYVPSDFARHIERQRNAAWQTLKEIRELFVNDNSFGDVVQRLFAQPLEEAEEEIALLKSQLAAKPQND